MEESAEVWRRGRYADAVHARVDRWFRTDAGRSLLVVEAAAVADRLADLFGYHLVQIGGLAGTDFLESSRIVQRCVVDLSDARSASSSFVHLRGRAASLPFESDSVDVALLPHVLEFEDSPHEALREAARVLVPEGHLLVCVFNPWSLFGLWRLVLGRTGSMPWDGHFLAQRRLRDWLKLLGLELTGVDSLYFRPPIGNARVRERLGSLDAVGRRLWPVFCGAYLLAARKRVSTLTPIRPRFAYRPRLVGVGLAGPTARIYDGE